MLTERERQHRRQRINSLNVNSAANAKLMKKKRKNFGTVVVVVIIYFRWSFYRLISLINNEIYPPRRPFTHRVQALEKGIHRKGNVCLSHSTQHDYTSLSWDQPRTCWRWIGRRHVWSNPREHTRTIQHGIISSWWRRRIQSFFFIQNACWAR